MGGGQSGAFTSNVDPFITVSPSQGFLRKEEKGKMRLEVVSLSQQVGGDECWEIYRGGLL